MTLDFGMLKIIPKRLKDGLLVVSPSRIRQVDVMSLAGLVVPFSGVVLPLVTALIRQGRITAKSKADLVGHPCTCGWRRDNRLQILNESTQIFYDLTRSIATTSTDG